MVSKDVNTIIALASDTGAQIMSLTYRVIISNSRCVVQFFDMFAPQQKILLTICYALPRTTISPEEVDVHDDLCLKKQRP